MKGTEFFKNWGFKFAIPPGRNKWGSPIFNGGKNTAGKSDFGFYLLKKSATFTIRKMGKMVWL